MTTLDELTTPLTSDQVKETTLAVATGTGLKVTSWNPFGITLAMIDVFSRSMSTWSYLISDMFRAPFLGYARGGWLTLLAKYNYNTVRYPARAANGVMDLINSQPTFRNAAPGALVVSNPITGQTYRNTTSYFSYGNDTVTVAFECEKTGTQGTSQPGQITQLVTSITGVTCTNLLAFVGVDEETDDALTERSRLARTALSPNGPKDVHRYVLTSPDLNPTSVPITRVVTRAVYATGHVVSYIATAAGAPTVGDVAISDASVKSLCEPMCEINEVYAATPVAVNVTCTVWVAKETLSDAVIVSRLQTAASAYMLSLPIGGLVVPPAIVGRLDLSMLSARIVASLASIVDLQVSSPFADITANPYDVFQLGTFTCNVVRV